MATIKDIAKAAGVSVGTVSRALNGHKDVKPKTREHVLKIAKQLSYSPNALARGLVSRKTNTIAVIISDMQRSGAKNSLPFDMLCGINDFTNDSSYDIMLLSTNPEKQKAVSIRNLCRERMVDGAILSGFRMTDPYLQEVLENRDFPCVLVDIPFTGENIGYVMTNNVAGAKSAVNYLIRNGHINIAMINGHDDAYVSKERLQGYIEALQEHGISYDPNKVLNGQFTEEGGLHAMYRLLIEQPSVTAVFCASDLMALGALEALGRTGREVPDTISIVGYDDITVAAYCTPKLTTVRQDSYEIGFQAAQLLVQMLEGTATTSQVLVRHSLMERESVRTHNSN